MLLVKVFSVTTLFTYIAASAIEAAAGAPSDYNALVEYANVVSVAYCLNKGLATGKLGDKKSSCPMKKCKAGPYKDIEILNTFNFNDWGEVGSGYYGINHKSKKILLVFRGTSSNRDWMSDMDTMPVKYEPMVNSNKYFKKRGKKSKCEGCVVHRGFYTFVKNNCAKVISDVADLKESNSDYQLVILGHSLGAALAVLSGIEFQLMGLDPLVVTYAGPKLGNHEMMKFTDNIFSEPSQEFDSSWVRVTHKNDLIPYLPPTTMVFEHGGFEYHINKVKLPHGPSTLERNGHSYTAGSVDAAFKFPSPGKLWPDSLGKYEHTHYFIKISGCKD